MLNQKELRAIESLSESVKQTNKSIKELNETIKKVNNRTNKNTLMYKLVEAVKDLGKNLKKSD